MDIMELKKGFFGYKKASVIEYVSDLQLNYSKKLQEKEECVQEQLAQLNQQITTLKQENKQLQESLDVLVSMLEIKTQK